MSAVRSDTKRQVMAEVIKTMKEAQDRGQDGWKAVERAFPGIPTDVVAEAFVDIMYAETDAWWENVERTIDGEVIRNALGNRGGAP